MTRRNLWILSSLISLAFAIGTGLLGMREIAPYQPQAGPLISPAKVSAELGNYQNRNRNDFLAIPNGEFVQSLAFIDTYDVNLTGYVWQRYDLAPPDDISRDTFFPAQIQLANTLLEEVYRPAEGESEVIGWHFDVTLRQHFDYPAYLLDPHDIWLQRWPRDFDQNMS